MWLYKAAMAGVFRWICSGEHVDRIAIVGDAIGHRTTVAVIVKKAHDVRGEVLGATHCLLDERRVGDEERVLPRNLPDGCLASELIVERARVIKHIGAQQCSWIVQIELHGVPRSFSAAQGSSPPQRVISVRSQPFSQKLTSPPLSSR